MAIQIGGTQVISNGKDLQNIRNSTLNGWINGSVVATKAMAEAGSLNDRLMTPLRVKEAINAIGGNVIKRVIRGSTAYSSYYYAYRRQGNNDKPGESGEANSVLISIPSINTAKSFISQGTRGSVLEARQAGTYIGSGTARINSATQVKITPGDIYYVDNGRNIGYVDWEVVEFN